MTVLTSPTTRTTGCGEVTVAVTEQLDVSTLQWFWAELKDAAALRPERLIVDLSLCPYLDAQAIRLLLDMHQLVWLQDGRLLLRGAKPPVMRLLSLAGVLSVFSLSEPAPLQVSA